jgi:acetyl-CoA acyltransferase
VAGYSPPRATDDPAGRAADAEMVAERFALSRCDCDEVAMRSHARAAEAIRHGRFARETVPVQVDGATVVSDRAVRDDAELIALAGLPPLFKPGGRVTAGNSARASDGAAAVLMLSAGRAAELGVRPRARILDHMAVGAHRDRRLEGPMVATTSILRRNHMTLADIDRVEVDELFAPVVAAWARDYEQDPATVNVRGGAIALGHPTGSTAARLVTTMLHVLEDEDAEVGLVTMCCGGGGTAALIQRL